MSRAARKPLRSSPPAPSPATPNRWPRRLIASLAIGIAIITFIAFIPALRGDFLDWDDQANFVRNTDFRGLGWNHLRWMFTTSLHGHYQPVTWLTMAIDYFWGGAVFGTHPVYGWGMDPRAFHLTSNILHALNAVLVFLLAIRLLDAGLIRHDAKQGRLVPPAAAAAALLFSVHPLRVENVAWITERRDLVSAMLLLLTVIAYLRSTRLDGVSRWRWVGISLGLYVLSLMAKVAGAPLAVALLAIDVFPLRRFQRPARHWHGSIWLEKVFFLAVAIAFTLITIIGQAGDEYLFPLAKHSLEARLVQSCYGLVFYVWATFVPLNLLPLYELRMPLNTAEPRFLASIALVFLVIVAISLLMIKRRMPGLIAAMVCYAAFLAPVLGLLQNGPQIVADRYSCLPSIGLSIAAAGGLHRFWTRPGAGVVLVRISIAATITAVLTLASLTWRQCFVWRSTETLWTCTLKHDPTSATANNGLGVYLNRSKNRPDLAIPYFQNAVRYDPFVRHYRSNLRYVLRQTGQMNDLIAAWLDEAEFSRKVTGRIEYDATFHFNAGNKALTAGDHETAREHYLVSLALDEHNAQAHHNLAAALEYLKRPEEAVAQYRRAVELNPALVQTHLNLADLLRRLNRVPEAIAALNTLLQVDPANAQGRAMLERLKSIPPQ